MLQTKATTRPSTKTGIAMLTSGRWVPPATCGSLAMKMSPSAMSSTGTLASTAVISPHIEARWIGSEPSAWAISRPERSRMAQEWSRLSLMFVEYALFISAMKDSSVIERSPLWTISRVIGSIMMMRPR